jgi:hypothetical protein
MEEVNMKKIYEIDKLIEKLKEALKSAKTFKKELIKADIEGCDAEDMWVGHDLKNFNKTCGYCNPNIGCSSCTYTNGCCL